MNRDESNVNFPQTARARAEVRHLLSAHNQLITAANSQPTIGLVFNCPTTAYLLSNDADEAPHTPILSESEYEELVDTMLLDRSRADTIFERLRANGVTPYTPRAIFSLAFPEDFFYRRTYKEKTEYIDEDGKKQTGEEPREVLFRQGIFISGELNKSDVKDGFIHEMWLKYGPHVTGRFITEAAFILDWYLERRGFSIGLADCLLADRKALRKEVDRIIAETRVSVNAIKAKSAETDFQKEAQELELILTLDKAKTATERLAGKDIMGKKNPLGVMVNSGSKGKASNVAQIAGILGEQFIVGKRPAATIYGNRTLCYFERDDESIEAGGFAKHSFIEGLSPAEFVFHMASSRVGLLDTSTKTADIGAINHRAQKMLENERIDYHGGVVNAVWMYNSLSYSEGYSPQEMILVKGFKSTGPIYMPFDLERIVDELNNN